MTFSKSLIHPKKKKKGEEIVYLQNNIFIKYWCKYNNNIPNLNSISEVEKNNVPHILSTFDYRV